MPGLLAIDQSHGVTLTDDSKNTLPTQDGMKTLRAVGSRDEYCKQFDISGGTIKLMMIDIPMQMRGTMKRDASAALCCGGEANLLVGGVEHGVVVLKELLPMMKSSLDAPLSPIHE